MSSGSPNGLLVDLDTARAAVAELAPEVARLIRSVTDPNAHAIGDWSVGEVAAHLSHVGVVEVEAATGRAARALHDMGLPEPSEISQVKAMNAAALAMDQVRDPRTLAERIEELATELVQMCRGSDKTVSWLLGAQLPLSAVCSHFVSEMAVHGHDIARGAGLPWRIDRSHARISIEGFYAPILAVIGRRAMSSESASCELRLRGGSRLVFSNTPSGLAVGPPNRRRGVDLHISADPAAMLLVMAGRSGRLRPALRGQILAWGVRPGRAMRMLSRIRAS